MSQKPVMEINEGDSVIVDVDSDGNVMGDLGEIVVATTRVETMLGDTAIHPEDKSIQFLEVANARGRGGSCLKVLSNDDSSFYGTRDSTDRSSAQPGSSRSVQPRQPIITLIPPVFRYFEIFLDRPLEDRHWRIDTPCTVLPFRNLRLTKP
ncbi:hypothetical protein V6N13_047487 [Hibiscus sabdariffa]